MSFAMFLGLVAVTLVQFAAEPVVEGTFDGECRYPQTVRDRATDDELVTCNQASIGADEIAFSLRSWGPRMTFFGTFENDRMNVTALALRNGDRVAARGVCQLYFADEELSTLACTATSERRRSYAANFVASRINIAR